VSIRPMLAVAVALASTLGFALPAVAGASSSPIISPTPGQRIGVDTVEIVVHARGEYGDLHATLNGHAITRDFAIAPGNRRMLRASVSHGLRRGPNVLKVRARVEATTRSATVRFTVTRKSPLVGAGVDRTVTVGSAFSLKGIAGATAAGNVRWKLTHTPQGSKVKTLATVGGALTPATTSRATTTPTTATTPATPSPATLPLTPLQPALTPDLPGKYTVQLVVGSGTSTATDSVTYDAIPADPLLAIDTRVPDTANPHGDEQPGIELEGKVLRAPYLQVTSDGNGHYAGNRPLEAYATWQVVAISRDTSQVIWNRTYGLCDEPGGQRWCRSPDNAAPGAAYDPVVTDPAADIAALRPTESDGGAIIVATSPDAPQFGDPAVAGFAKAFLTKAGFPDDWNWQRSGQLVPHRGTVAMIGVAGMEPGEADTYNGAGARMTGFVTHDQLGHYHFLSGARPLFDTRSAATCDAANCSITQTLGTTSVRGLLPRGQGGYVVTGWDRLSLRPVSSKTFAVDANDAHTAANTTAMLADLRQLQASGVIVTVTTLHTPGESPGTLIGADRPNWNHVVQTIADLGGTKDGFVRSATTPGTDYSLIGYAGLGEDNGPEATQPGARLRGALVRDAQSKFAPTNVSSLDAPAEHLMHVLLTPTGTYGANDTWPYADASTGPGQAIACIGTELGKTTNPRAEYRTIPDQAAANGLSEQIALFEKQGPPATCPVSAKDYATAADQLQQELLWVGKVRGYMTALAYPEHEASDQAFGQATVLANELQKSMKELDEKQEIVANTLGFLASFAEVLAPGFSYNTFEKITTVLEETYATLDLAEKGLERSQDGARSESPTVSAAELATTLQSQQLSAAAAYGPMGDILIGDYDKLKEVGTYAGCVEHSAASGGCPAGLDEYSYTPTTMAQLTNTSLRAMARTIYGTLVPKTYGIWDTGLTRAPKDPYDNFQCPNDLGTSVFRSAPESAISSSLEDAGYGPVKRSRVYVMVRRSGLFWGYVPREVTDRMFDPVAAGDGAWDKGGLAMDPLALMRDTPTADRFLPSTTCYYTVPGTYTREPGFTDPLR
jgi:hypothetical protein